MRLWLTRNNSSLYNGHRVSQKEKNFFIKLQHRRKACVLYSSNNSSLSNARRDPQRGKKIKKIFIKLQHRRKACVLYM